MTQVTNHTPQASNNTKLKTRTLWFDGDSSYPPNKLHTAVIGSGGQLFVDELTDDVKQFNALVPDSQRIRVKTDIRPLEFNWIIPESFQKINIVQYISERLIHECADDAEFEAKANRVAKELKLYKQHNLYDVLRVLIYVINTLNANSVVWGVGRGSSVSSYVLYLIGVHDVDSIKYGLDIEDFLH